MRDADLQKLRRRAARALDEVQSLPGFKDRFDAVVGPPEWARDWSWDAVVNATESDRWRPGRIRWAEHPDASTSPYRKNHGRLPLSEHGGVLVPVDEPLPDSARREALTVHRAAVTDFAASVLFGAQWSARAVHDAIRLEQQIRLPDRPEPFIAPPLFAPFTLDPDQPLPRSWLIELAQALLAAADNASSDDGSGALGSEEPSAQSMPGETVWRGAVEAIRQRLARGRVDDTPRRYLSRLRPWLDAAVNGELGAPALLRVDDPDYPARRRVRDKEARVKRRAGGTAGTAGTG